MSAEIQNKILDALQSKPNQKADELARSIGLTKTQINQILYGALKGAVSQDRSYRWSLSSGYSKPQASPKFENSGFANTDLAKMCRYYLACLGYDDTGVSTFLTSKFGEPDYLELQSLPKAPDDFSESETARKMLGRKRSEQGRYGLYFGYPTNVSLLKSKKTGWEGYMVEPILLFPIEQQRDGKLTIDLSYPIINQKPFQAFTNAERDMLMSELVQLEQELGIGNTEDRPDIDEIAMRLQAIRPEWPWREDIDPGALEAERPSMSEIKEAGIYNRAVILMAEKSPFTQGLEKELRDLGSLPEEKYRNTALGRWINGSISTTEETVSPRTPVIEVLPMNSEQRQAVSSALNRPLTIITGPPGTGKSQVVTNLLINAAWSGKRVLFASKNNRAVDVVETRVNALGSRPILLRVGSQAYQVRLAEYVLSLLSATTSKSEQDEFSDAKVGYDRSLAHYALLQRETERLVQLRNHVDRLERDAEDARIALGAELFSKSVDTDIPQLQSGINKLEKTANEADKNKASSMIKLIWPFVSSQRLASVNSSLDDLKPLTDTIKIKLPSHLDKNTGLTELNDAISQAKQKINLIAKSSSYLQKLYELQSLRSLEDISKEEKTVLDNIAKQSKLLWKLWLRIQPSTLSTADRQKFGKYTSILRMVIEAGDEGKLAAQVHKKYNEMLREVSHLLPCWAVTSLSARGRIPFEPGNFDIVVFDEASQCDIASALPLLYRAKQVVIIGDAKQLSHISSLHKGQDQALLERYELLDDFPHWSYSHQSLFGLGSTQVSGDDVVSLVDHHRSHADIINFSNNEFYEERLRVATNYNDLKFPNRSEPGIRWIDVKGTVSRPGTGGALNASEANAVVVALRDLVLNKGYAGSVGVVTPFRSQANLITHIVNKDSELVAALTQRSFLADTVHKFQGDERDVMLFSPVISSETPIGALGFLRSNGNLFNVAITRARAQLIVVGDLSGCSSCDIGYLSRFATYTSSLTQNETATTEEALAELGPKYPMVARPEIVSEWEHIFYGAAYSTGIRLIPQYPIEKYIVDFLLAKGDRKLAIEIDGERYHRNWTGELCRRDQLRNQRLIELGYDVMRFWVYEVRDDISGCLKKIKDWTS